MKKRIGILIGIVFLALFILPTTYSYIKERVYYKNHIVAITTFTEVTILDKIIEDDKFYLEFTFDSEHYIDKYKLEDNVRIYQLSSKELYEQVDLSRSDDYIGLTIESEIDKNKVSNQEINDFQSDPFLILSKQEYSNFITIVNIHQR
ncbi:hypothetical protein J2S74_005178 [Evansella vedderi]|uniref:Uncharacterized protein n=1 Tax=Evansella vedderi TaxID=38282 RepID=A0ABU0A2J5_9BACI|nr:hypothetical protein [Evansella vedderi]MDQ0257716.1 hypothetical protein [Evansella vedderi]